MFKRFLILLGAKTTAGGTVKTVTSFMSLNGVPYALEGDLIDCPSCGNQGIIKCVPPRLDATCNGKQYALEQDLCICGCSPPPQLIANQSHNCQCIDDADGMNEPQEAVAAHTPASAHTDSPLPLQLIRDSDDEPFRNRHYVLELRDGKIEGETDSEGFTKPLTSVERAALVAWHVERDIEPTA
jgi:uncharacterized Zn-binding protein involved in type VI secretion